MNKWTGAGYIPDWSNDFFEPGGLPCVWVDAIDGKARLAEDIDSYMEPANDWASYCRDFRDPNAQISDNERGIERCVGVMYF